MLRQLNRVRPSRGVRRRCQPSLELLECRLAPSLAGAPARVLDAPTAKAGQHAAEQDKVLLITAQTARTSQTPPSQPFVFTPPAFVPPPPQVPPPPVPAGPTTTIARFAPGAAPDAAEVPISEPALPLGIAESGRPANIPTEGIDRPRPEPAEKPVQDDAVQSEPIAVAVDERQESTPPGDEGLERVAPPPTILGPAEAAQAYLLAQPPTVRNSLPLLVWVAGFSALLLLRWEHQLLGSAAFAARKRDPRRTPVLEGRSACRARAFRGRAEPAVRR
jgi:hypothetical protein